MRRYYPAFVLTTLSIAATSLTPAPIAVASLQEDDQIVLELEPEEDAPKDGPLVLSALDDESDDEPNDEPNDESNANEEAKSESNVEQAEGEASEEDAEALPKEAIQKATDDIDEEEMKTLSRQPLFKEFANAVGVIAPMTPIVEGSDLNVPGSEFFNGLDPQGDEELVEPLTQPKREVDADRLQLLESSLALADSVDLNALALTPSQRATFEAIDSEIARLWPLWIDAELNRDVVGRRELDWRGRDPFRYSPAAHKTIDAPGSDWALALDEPFFFRVVDLTTGEDFYTKAGDFEQSIETGEVALFREERVFTLDVEPGLVAPTGRARRVKVLKDGRIQGVDESARLVTDVNLGQIALYTFGNSGRLKSVDGVLFVPTPYSGAPTKVKLPAVSKVGVTQHKLALSNGAPEEIFAQLVALCKSKSRLVELLSQPKLRPDVNTANSQSSRPVAVPIDSVPNDSNANQDLVDPEIAPAEVESGVETNDDEFILEDAPKFEEGEGGVLQPPFLRPERR